ncbi:LD-carboxypeptidase [Pedobacter sp. HDW13]|uniref:S66 peptidase family protein n=1 Tax=unclassified Pedobacter TaxID=2628915 RepID=UPI000F5A44D1|nr:MULTISPECIES: LD-carboxypeptidase [unclassified Pedobacter]QIL42118.1 LD-carboxypeptidase [Pedobacter sp. HDW13]RQO76649.1 LD-carboxypeptidase [Pedobacter sp. KBW01]
MNRKHFLSSFIAATAVLPAFKTLASTLENENSSFKIPPYLKAGDTIGITSPAGYITQEQIQPSVLQMQSWGFNIKVGETIGKRDFTYGGTDEERLADFQQMLNDPNIKAIMCARGGYGFVRIIDQLDFSAFKRNPKWIIGFSDITVLHCHLAKNFGIASIHSKMCNSFPDDWAKAEPIQIETILSIKNALIGEQMGYTGPLNSNNRFGKNDGILVGGNLSIIETLAGSNSDLDTKNKILFIEDTGEYLYSIDRMLWNLKRSGKLKNLKGLIIGGFKVKPDDAGEEFGKTVYDIVLEKVKEYIYPVAFDFPVGHQRNNFALKCGVNHTLMVNESGATLRTN